MEIIDLLKSNLITEEQKDSVEYAILSNFQRNKGIQLFVSNDFKELDVREKAFSPEDMILKVCLDALHLSPKPDIPQIAINCDSTDILFGQMIESDNKVRNEGGDMLVVDNRNRMTLISIIEQCGWIEDRTKQIWWLSQHSLREYIPHYYPELKKRVGRNNLSTTNLAYMEDRMLMNAGYPQIYGTQSDGGKLHLIFEPELVNQRRKKAGFLISKDKIQTIEMECEYLGITWEDELARMKAIQANMSHNK